MDDNAVTRTVATNTKVPGFHWRTLAWGDGGHSSKDREVEQKFTEEDRVCFDELCIDDWFHIEQMSDHNYWMRIGDAMVNVCVADGKCTVIIERDQY